MLLGAGLFPIIDSCPMLERLDLTSCRGVSVADRRRFFEVCFYLSADFPQSQWDLATSQVWEREWRAG
jgi:hypothetical protein